jgi:hypothetical protein
VILEYVIGNHCYPYFFHYNFIQQNNRSLGKGTSSTASALSSYVNQLAGNKISNALNSSMPMNSDALGPYPDFLAFGFCIVITGHYKNKKKNSNLFCHNSYELLTCSMFFFFFLKQPF